jgi:hypothetical protein
MSFNLADEYPNPRNVVVEKAVIHYAIGFNAPSQAANTIIDVGGEEDS